MEILNIHSHNEVNIY